MAPTSAGNRYSPGRWVLGGIINTISIQLANQRRPPSLREPELRLLEDLLLEDLLLLDPPLLVALELLLLPLLERTRVVDWLWVPLLLVEPVLPRGFTLSRVPLLRDWEPVRTEPELSRVLVLRVRVCEDEVLRSVP